MCDFLGRNEYRLIQPLRVNPTDSAATHAALPKRYTLNWRSNVDLGCDSKQGLDQVTGNTSSDTAVGITEDRFTNGAERFASHFGLVYKFPTYLDTLCGAFNLLTPYWTEDIAQNRPMSWGGAKREKKEKERKRKKCLLCTVPRLAKCKYCPVDATLQVEPFHLLLLSLHFLSLSLSLSLSPPPVIDI